MSSITNKGVPIRLVAPTSTSLPFQHPTHLERMLQITLDAETAGVAGNTLQTPMVPAATAVAAYPNKEASPSTKNPRSPRRSGRRGACKTRGTRWRAVRPTSPTGRRPGWRRTRSTGRTRTRPQTKNTDLRAAQGGRETNAKEGCETCSRGSGRRRQERRTSYHAGGTGGA